MRNLKWGIVVLLMLGAVWAYFYNLSSNSKLDNTVRQEERQAPAVSAPEPGILEKLPETKAAQPDQKHQQAISDREEAPIAAVKESPNRSDSVNLAEYEYSIKKSGSQGIKLAPGVTVKGGAVHIAQDEHSDEVVDIERNPKNTNNDYQVVWRKKF